jgi:hypothetical protein
MDSCDGVPEYRCYKCLRGFWKQWQLNRHLKDVHKVVGTTVNTSVENQSGNVIELYINNN